MKIIDTHIHSEFSPDGRMKMEDAIARAKLLGLSGLSFTDHYDVEAPGDNGHFSFDPLEQQKKIDMINDNSGFFIGKGVELGLQPESIESALDIMSNYSFDVIIASIHFVDGLDPYHGPYYDMTDEKRAYGRYLEVMYESITGYEDFDILGHFDYITRYSPHDNKTLSMKKYGDYLDSILKYIAENGKALEINTNTYRIRNGATPVLDMAVLKHFRQLGGEFITLGSDAHSVDRVGDNLNSYIPMIAEAGFNRLTHFEKRRPVLASLFS